MHKNNIKRQGFTLIEAMICVVLAAVLLDQLARYKANAPDISWDCTQVPQSELLSYEKACLAGGSGTQFCQDVAKKRLCKKVVEHKTEELLQEHMPPSPRDH